jgi:hypothetical protein
MKRFVAAALIASSLAMAGCVTKVTGPGSAGVDLSKMQMVDQNCAIWVLFFGPFQNATLTKKVDVVQYSLENYVVWGRLCAEGYANR